MSVTDISSTVVAITGAGSGIGEATALHLAARGARVVLGARRTDRLAQLVDELGPDRAAYVATDVRRREDVQALVDLAVDRFGRLDVLHANAGVMPISLLDKLRVDDWDAMVDVNLKGVLHGIAAALPVFRAQASGHFVTTGSTAALRIVPTQAVYSATKVAVRHLMEGLRQEAGPDLRVTTIEPGYVRTNAPAHVTDPDIRAQLADAGASLAIAPEAIARAVAYAIEQPPDVDVGEIVVRPTAQA